MPGPLPLSRAESSSRARPRAAARWTLAFATLIAPFSPALGAAPARYVELRAGAAVETTKGSGFGAAPVSTVAVGLQLRDWFAAEASLGVIDATLRGQEIALPGQTYLNRPYTSADVRVVAVPLALTARFVLPSDRVSPFALAGVGFAVAHAVATPELDGPIQREDFPSFGVHLGFGFVADVTEGLRAGVEVRYLHLPGRPFDLRFELPGFHYAASVGWRF